MCDKKSLFIDYGFVYSRCSSKIVTVQKRSSLLVLKCEFESGQSEEEDDGVPDAGVQLGPGLLHPLVALPGTRLTRQDRPQRPQNASGRQRGAHILPTKPMSRA